MRHFGLLACFAAVAVAQQRPVNLNFMESGAGGQLAGWRSETERGYSVERFESCRTLKSRCVVLRYSAAADPTDFGGLAQSFDGAELRGKQIRYRAWAAS